MSEVKKPITPDQTLKIVNKDFWKEMMGSFSPDKDSVDVMQYATDWGINMQREFSKDSLLTLEIAERCRPNVDIPQRLVFKMMVAYAREVLFATWKHGEELAKAYNFPIEKIKDMRANASDKNTPRRRKEKSLKQTEDEAKQSYHQLKINREEKYARLDEATLVSLGDEKLELKNEEYYNKYIENHPNRKQMLQLFMKICQINMREQNENKLTRAIISHAINQIHSPMPADASLNRALTLSWKYGGDYGTCMGFTQGRMNKMQESIPAYLKRMNAPSK